MTKSFKKISNEHIQEAKSVSIVDLARSQGVEIRDLSSSTAEGVEHDSLKFDKSKNIFKWFSQDIGGDNIAFVQKYLGVEDFVESVDLILSAKEKGLASKVEIQPEKREPFQYYFKNQSTIKNAVDYLNGARGIDLDILSALHSKGILQEDLYKNAIFVWNRQGQAVGASVQGTKIDKEEFGKRGTQKHIAKNSEHDFGFNVSLGKPNKMIIFEAPIDLLSYWSMNKDINNTMLVAMDGLKEKTVFNLMEYMYQSKNSLPTQGVFVGVDNDPAGSKFADQMLEHQYEIKGGQQTIKFEKLSPSDNYISSKLFNTYKEISESYGIDWKKLAAVHKASSNLSENLQIGNGYNYTGDLSIKEDRNTSRNKNVALNNSNVLFSKSSLDSFVENAGLFYTDDISEAMYLFPDGSKVSSTYEGIRGDDYNVISSYFDEIKLPQLADYNIDRQQMLEYAHAGIGVVQIVPETDIALIMEGQNLTEEQNNALKTSNISTEKFSKGYQLTTNELKDLKVPNDKIQEIRQNLSPNKKKLNHQLKVVAQKIQNSADNNTSSWQNIYTNDNYASTSLEVEKMINKTKKIYQMYQDKGVQIIDTVPKDWNDVRMNSLNNEAEKRILSADFTNDKGMISIEKTIQDNKENYLAKDKGTNEVVPFLEAESPRQMEFLVKSYGYNAVDKQDEHSLNKTAVTHPKPAKPAPQIAMSR